MKNNPLQSDDWSVKVSIDGTPLKGIPSEDRTRWRIQLPCRDSYIVLGSVLVDENGQSYRIVMVRESYDGLVELIVRTE